MVVLRSSLRLTLALLAAGLTFVLPADLAAQTPTPRCLQPGKLEQVRDAIRAKTEQPLQTEFKAELIAAATQIGDLARKMVAERPAEGEATKAHNAFAAIWSERICSTLNEKGWPSRSAIDTDGANAFLFLILKALSAEKRLELYPLVVAAFEAKEIDGSETLAAYVDGLRLAIGRKQLYGSQAFVRDGFLVMAPIENIGDVDKRRASFGLQPLRAYERSLELSYRLPLIRLVTEPPLSSAAGKVETATASNRLGDLGEEVAVINVETAFVSLDVIIPDSAESGSAMLEKGDFQLFDSGKQVEIETFAKTEAPFDIVLLLDLSGSTSDKVGLIKRSTRRFVEMKRPNDRVAVVAFDDTQRVISELEADKAVLLERIKKIEGRGASRIWDAVKFGLDMLEEKSGTGRRRAVVLMSDGADNQLALSPTLTPRMGFADLVEAVQRSNAAIFPIYLDTEDRSNPGSKRIYAQARQTLAYIAEQSAGNMYTARKLDDLADIYDRVLRDVGTVYTLGFTPDVESGTPQWRELRVEIPSRPNLKIKHRPGYLTR